MHSLITFYLNLLSYFLLFISLLCNANFVKHVDFFWRVLYNLHISWDYFYKVVFTMTKTYDELLKDTNFMEMIFTEISKLDSIINKLSAYNCAIADMPLSVKEKEQLDQLDMTLRNMFKLAGCEENLPVSTLQNLIDLYSDVYSNIKDLNDEQIQQVAAGADLAKSRGPEFIEGMIVGMGSSGQ